MQRITRSQTILKEEAEEALRHRKMVYLAGQPNGKTSIMWKIIGELAVDEKGSLIEHIPAKRSGENEVVILPKVAMPRADRLTIVHVMRQVLQASGEKAGHHLSQYNLYEKYYGLMHELRKRRTIICIAIDNAELLGEKAFTILKHLNELQNRGERIGISVLIAGRFGKIRFPGSFLQHCDEIQIGKISHDEEIRELIQTHFPQEIGYFSDPALRRITRQCETTLQVIRAAKMAIAERKRLRDTEIGTETVDMVLSGIGLLKAA